MVTYIRKIKNQKDGHVVSGNALLSPLVAIIFVQKKNVCLKIIRLPIKFKSRMGLYDAKGNIQSINSFSKNNFQQKEFKTIYLLGECFQKSKN